MRLVNLTPHEIRLMSPAGVTTTLLSEGIARVDSAPGLVVETLPWCLLAAPDQRGAVVGLPEPQPDTLLIVSAVVGDAILQSRQHRPDVVVLGTGPQDDAIREKGQIKTVTRLKQIMPTEQ